MDVELETVEEYYSYMSQGNTFAPRYEDLSEAAKQQWLTSFAAYKTLRK